MTQETIKRFIKESHENAIEKGFYECPECCGDGEGDYKDKCTYCNGSGIDQNKNIGELLMLIVSELGEALEAHRCGRFAENKLCDSVLKNLKIGDDFAVRFFELEIKDTFEDEIADVFIRLFDLCGYLDLNIPEKVGMNSGTLREYMSRKNVGECLLTVTREICEKQTLIPLEMLLWFCDIHNIPIEKHIIAKMAYNKTRPRKHGKEY